MSRRINWGADATDAKYRTEDTGTPGDFVVAEDTDGNTVLLKYDDTAGEWVYGGPVNMSGSDISNVGQLSSTSVNTEQADVTGEPVVRAERSTISSGNSAGSWVNVVDLGASDPLDIFNSNAQIVPTSDVPVMVIVQAQIEASSGGDLVEVRIRDVDSNTDVNFGKPLDALAASTDGVHMTLTGTLNANNAHELQVRNLDSAFDVGRNQSYYNLFKRIVHS